ncbi:hypothetical protein [Bacteriovorax sp. BSW11_IV]|uniref:hypothetical protein n=1 Tax=Bacteriovorax sp. BSW11_IV TaxID=1353529 RepID=UPI0012DD5F7D|nr:hypothetical protein [Bacteriovorax sp. BSW11_IV]
MAKLHIEILQNENQNYVKEISKRTIALQNKLNAFLENSPLKDHEQKFKIKITDTKQIDGLFVSNEDQKIILLSNKLIHSSEFEQVLAHEIFHAIHNEFNPNEKSWIKEGLAQLFEYYLFNRYNTTNVSASFNSNAYFFSEYTFTDVDRPLYGQHFLYFHYLTRQCGNKDLFWKLITNKESLSGILLIDKILQSITVDKIQCKNFSNSFIYFNLSRVINSYNIVDGELDDSYYLIPSTIKQKEITSISEIQTIGIHPYSVFFINKQLGMNLETKSLLSFWIKRETPFKITNDINEVTDSLWTNVLFKF